MLVDPDFLLRVHRDPAGQVRLASRGSRHDVYRLSDLEVASRLSFFLWSSIPDERLLDLAERGQLTRPPVLEQEVRRMLADPRAVEALVDDFAAQWLNLRRVDEVVVHPDSYPGFDGSLLEAFKQETTLFVASTLREDRSVLDLLRANYTFVNERLARHYGLPGIYGSRFRRVTLPNLDQRGGLLAQRWAAGDDLLSRPHVARAAGQMAARQHLWCGRAAASAGRRHELRRRPSPASCRRPFASVSRSTGGIRCAPVAIR